MANIKSALKEIRKSKARFKTNKRTRDNIKKSLKAIRKLIKNKKKNEAEKAYIKLTKLVDKAAKTHTIHKNTASRYKSRIQKAINKINES